jgi:acyl-homoserine lactone acylase PvdQ
VRVYSMDVHIPKAVQMKTLLFSFYTPQDYPDLAGAAALLAGESDEATAENTSILLLLHWFNALESAYAELPHDPALLTEDEKTHLADALRTARDEVLACWSTLAVPWGEVHFIERGGKFPADGGTGRVQTLFLVGAPQEECEPLRAQGGSSFLQVTQLTPDAVTSRSLRPIGMSNDPASPFYADETARFAARDPDASYRPSVFTDEEVMETYLGSVTVLP